MTTLKGPICQKCKHFNRKEYGKFKCKAFPNGIPDEIVFSEFDHTKPHPSDNGIQFEPLEEGS